MMRKNYFSSLKGMLAAALTFAAFTTASANSSYYWHYASATAYPTGKGTVYIDNPEEPYDSIAYADEAELKFVISAISSSASVTLYAQPAEGYNFVGWTTQTTNEDGSKTLAQSIFTTDNPATVSDYASVSSDSEIGDSYPLEPDNQYVAVFGKDGVAYIPGQQDNFGTVTYSRFDATEDGDTLTLTAIPAGEDFGFEYWTDDQGNQYTDNPLQVTVNGSQTFTPRFSCVRGGTFDFPADGAIALYNNNKYVTLPYDAYEAGSCGFFTIRATSWQEGKDYITNAADESGYMYQAHENEGFLLYGKGTFSVQTEEDQGYTLFDEENYLIADSLGYYIEEMPSDGLKYYVLASDHKFHQVSEGFIDSDRWALVVPDSVNANSVVIDFVLEGAGETVDNRLPILNPFDLTKFVQTDQTAIDGVEADEPVMTEKQIYDLGGRILAAPRKGINIVNGKKLLVK